MDRIEKTGLGVAAVGHILLFGLLSVGFLATPNPNDLKSKPIEVSLTDEIALESGSPTPNADPKQIEAPEEGPLELASTPPPPAPPTPRVETTPPGSTASPAVKSALAAEIVRQLKPHWRAPTGADADQLVTVVSARLNRDGSLSGTPEIVSQTGVTASNRAQADLHKERAIRAVQLAAPFNLPEEFYNEWKLLRPRFDRRLSQ